MKKYQYTRFRLSWLQVLLALALASYGFCTQGCRDQYPDELAPCDASRLVGKWQGLSSPYWHYDFNLPHLRQQVVVAGAVVADQTYIYGVRNDTLWASGDGGDRVWRVCFVNDSLAEVKDVSGVLQMPAFLLGRE